jgi:hypothetical protein
MSSTVVDSPFFFELLIYYRKDILSFYGMKDYDMTVTVEQVSIPLAAEVDSYLADRQHRAALLQAQNQTQFDPAGIRDRLLARRAEQRS